MRGARLAAVASIVLLAGCGSTPLSVKQLRTQAGAICAAATARTNAIPAPTKSAQEEAFLRRGIAVLTPELAQLRALHAPSELAREYAKALDAFQQKLGALNRTVEELRKGADPVSSIQALQHRLAPIETHEDAAWRSLQVPACVIR